MSVSAANKKNSAQPALATTGRGAPLYATLGIACLTLGVLWVLALISAVPGSKNALAQLADMVKGLGGKLYPGLPALLILAGVMLLVSCRHRVSVRNFVITAAIYWLALAGYTLAARVPARGASVPYMEYVGAQTLSTSLTSYLQGAYRHGTSGTGGLVGMLLAHPLWRFIGRVGGILAVAVVLIVLVFVLFRFNPGELFRSASDLGEKHRKRRLQKQQERQAAQGAQRQSEMGASPMDEAPYGEMGVSQTEENVPPAYYQAAPIYNAHPVYQQAQPDAQGFYPVQPDLYDERFPLHDPAPAAAARQAAPSAAPAPAQQEKPSWLDRIRRLRQSDVLNPAQQPAPASPPSAASAAPPSSRPAAARPAPAVSRGDEGNPAFAPMPAVQALDDADDLPWDTAEPLSPAPRHAKKPVQTPDVPAPAPAQEKRPAAPEPEQDKRPFIPSSAVPAPAVRPTETAAPVPAQKQQPVAADSSWAAQVREKAAQLQSDLPEHTTRKGEAKPVYTDPVMPITGERVPIKPAPEMKAMEKGRRLDGTSAPVVKQGSMDLSVPYQAPPIRLLKEARHVPQADAAQEDERRAQVIEGTLRSFGVDSEVKQIMHGPSITRFAIQIAPGVKVSRVANTADNLALDLKTQHVRVEAPIQGTNYIGIEVPNHIVSTVSLREVLDSPEMTGNPSPLLVALGKDIAGAPVLCDLSKMPHLLIAGATGSGKSVCINSIVCSLLYRTSPDQVRLIMVDPKQVELSVYNGIPHLLVPVVSDPRKAAGALSWVVQEMLERYGKFSAQGVRNLAGYNKANQGTDQVLPNIVVIIDEMADLMEVCRKDVEESIRRLAALARAAGIYMVLATQRPSVDVITGVIKNNIPSRIAFAVSSGTDSRTIIDINGAEKLMGKGDMLYKPTGTSPVRVQGCFVSDDEVNAIAQYISSRYQADYDPNIVEHLENANKESSADEVTGADEEPIGNGSEGSFGDLLQQAIEMAVEDGQSSTSMLQRRLRVGYARAGRLIDEMEKRGIISHSEGSKPRKTLVTREEYYEMLRND